MPACLRRLSGVACAAALLLLAAQPSRAAAVVSADYRLPPRADPDIAGDVTTEIWATLWRPKSLNRTRHPLVVFLHGNHATCGRFDGELGVRVDDRIDYTGSGTCPRGYVVTPNHKGYGYLADRLASAGYVVVSINANRGINAAPGVPGDEGLNLRRGRLVLKHLQLLSRWNRAGAAPASLGFDPKGKLDLGQVGLMGHSRGGEGMRAALAQYKDAASPWRRRIGPVGFKALYEIAPVDGQTGRTLDALGVAWNVLLPFCDGDVFDLQGIKPFDRMLLAQKEQAPRPKSTFAVYGANHNFYNTEWQLSDSPGCAGRGNTALFPQLKGSPRQRQTAVASLVPFMRAHVGKAAQPARARLFDPATALPPALAKLTRIDRGYTDTPDGSSAGRIDDFDRPTGTSGSGQPEVARGIGIEHLRPVDHDGRQRAAAITWQATGPHLFQTKWSAPGSGRSLAGYRTLEFRASRQCDASCTAPAQLNLTAATDFTVQLVRPDGSLSASVGLARHLTLRGPAGVGNGDLALLHPILATARIPLRAFGLGAGASVRGVRYTFDRTRTGAIYLANLRLSKLAAAAGAGMESMVAEGTADGEDATTGPAAAPMAGGARIVAIRSGAAPAAARSSGGVEVEIAADRPLPVTDALPTLVVGERRFQHSRYAGTGATDRLVFTIDRDSFARLPDGTPAVLWVGAARRLPLGTLDKAMLR